MKQTLSLDKTKQRSVEDKTKKLKKGIKAGRISIKEGKREQKRKVAEARGLVYIGHLPHGFYEEEMRKYFKQFGRITNLKVCRSKNTGNSKGYGYVEFAHSDVGKIAAETMNNYIMFKKRLIANFVPHEKRPKFIFQGTQSTPEEFSKQKRQQQNADRINKKINSETHFRETEVRITRLQKRLQKLNDLGIKYDLKPVDVPKGINK